jgi:predicted double-glycine peptidase
MSCTTGLATRASQVMPIGSLLVRTFLIVTSLFSTWLMAPIPHPRCAHGQESSRSARKSKGEPDEWTWRWRDQVQDLSDARRDCGRHCLYIWLSLTGREITWSAVRDQVLVSDDGSSLADLVRASANWRPALRAIRATPDDLRQIPLPAIAHLWLNEEGQRVGHYVVLLRVDSDSVCVADGTTSFVGRSALADFLRVWSGYLLVTSDTTGIWLERAVFMINLVLLAALARSITKRARSSHRSWACLAILAAIMISSCNKIRERDHSAGAAASSQSLVANRENVLAVPVTDKDLGVVELGGAAKASFTVENVSNSPLSLTLGDPSCSCASATLSRQSISPGERAEVTMVVSTAHETGPQVASVTLGSVQPEHVWRFLVRVLLEGLELDPYTLRLPDSTTTTPGPDPLTGRLIVGKSDKQVEILRTTVVGAAGLKLQKAELLEKEEFPRFCRYSIKIPVSLATDARPQNGTYRVRVTFRIDDKMGEAATFIHVIRQKRLPRPG